ncbi:SCO family protein [Mucisphaera calidilacus]|uniref:Thioredoxin domain-containing protein n=1 Tax=Mucisphaera calidilacus TaxID=2527982 RepID=A0A518C0F4_9BACT|nr:SCO family protein [Mucisphaera calidilacus]QDU72711.1 hypothetical protein Pan265_25850 [Mucisphaera calidilacus]
MNARTTQRLFLAAGFVMLTIAGSMIALTTAARFRAEERPAIDPAYGTAIDHPAPVFTLTDASGEPFSSEELAGEIWVVDFFFTRCQLVCPIMTLNMSRLQRQLDAAGMGEIRLVSISVDPENDTPEVITAFAGRYNADPERWTFLTGDRATIWPLVEEGFQLALDEDPGNTLMPITHSSRFLVVNREGVIVASFDGLTTGSIDALTNYLATLE